MKYVEPRPADRETLAAAIDGGDGQTIAQALLGVTYNDPDPEWVQDMCLHLIADHPDTGVRAIAITCLGHLARIHGRLDVGKVRPVLSALRADPDLGGRAEDALDDVDRFVRTA